MVNFCLGGRRVQVFPFRLDRSGISCVYTSNMKYIPCIYFTFYKFLYTYTYMRWIPVGRVGDCTVPLAIVIYIDWSYIKSKIAVKPIYLTLCADGKVIYNAYTCFIIIINFYTRFRQILLCRYVFAGAIWIHCAWTAPRSPWPVCDICSTIRRCWKSWRATRTLMLPLVWNHCGSIWVTESGTLGQVTPMQMIELWFLIVGRFTHQAGWVQLVQLAGTSVSQDQHSGIRQ